MAWRRLRTFSILACVVIVFAPTALALNRLQAAVNWVNAGPYSIPPGTTVLAGNVSDGAIASTSPDGSTITIDFEAIAERYPGLEGDVSDLGGVLVVAITHESIHARAVSGLESSDNNTPCGHAAVHLATAAQHCSLIQEIHPSERANLCEMYNKNRDCYNNGCATPGNGGASTFHEGNCGTSDPPYPGDMPPCPGCP